jgi:hypothetical protein
MDDQDAARRRRQQSQSPVSASLRTKARSGGAGAPSHAVSSQSPSASSVCGAQRSACETSWGRRSGQRTSSPTHVPSRLTGAQYLSVLRPSIGGKSAAKKRKGRKRGRRCPRTQSANALQSARPDGHGYDRALRTDRANRGGLKSAVRKERGIRAGASVGSAAVSAATVRERSPRTQSANALQSARPDGHGYREEMHTVTGFGALTVQVDLPVGLRVRQCSANATAPTRPSAGIGGSGSQAPVRKNE